MLWLTVLSLPAGLAFAQGGPVDFTRDVRPILSNHCFACHGPDEEAREAELSLLSFEEGTRDRGGYAALVPGDPGASELWLRVTDEEDPMPPEELHKPLDEGQREILRRWIEQGASYAPHWAYVFPERVPSPEGEGDAIDLWIERRLELEELTPSPPADPATLLRRLATDLTGLPPTLDELDDFLADPSEEAYAAYVEALFASPHHGERMALFWLDLVRYADTVGYHGDQEHRVWPYRDWVIDAFGTNMPFDAFTEAQLAGDLLENGSQDELVATTYNRLIQTSHEGGVQLEEYRAIYMADRVRNVSDVWMGATVGCAQCHDHKYDPYTAHDYYALGAFFADIDEEEHLENPYGGLNTTPTRRTPEMRVYGEADRRREAELHERVSSARDALVAAREGLAGSRAAWEASLVADREVVDALWVDDELDTGGETSGEWIFESGETPASRSGSRHRRQSSQGRIQHYSVKTERVLAVEEGGVLYTWVRFEPEHAPRALMLQFHVQGLGWQRRAVWGDDSIDYGRREEDWDGYRRMGSLPESGDWRRLEVHTSTLGLSGEHHIDGWAFTQFGGTVLWDRAGLERGAISATLRSAASAAARTDTQQFLLDRLQQSQSPEVRRARTELAEAEEELEELLAVLPLTLYTRRIDPPREVRILPRGNFLDTSGPVVEAAVPSFLGVLETGGRATRLDLARWLTRPRSEGGVGELSARVLVNRLWAMLMGEGLCPSLDDFGGQGRPPTHLELLDTLALELLASGWDVRALLRRIVTSRAYRRSSIPDEEAARRDPGNRLFARQSRYRLPAELVRDRILAVSGLLVDEVGGPSVKPPQPEGLYRHLNFPQRRYMADEGAHRWRRGLYVHRQRQFLHPMLRAFDAPAQTSCTARRPVSNTPLAALNLLNDPSALEAARSLARVVLETGGGDRERLAQAMRRVTGRHPSEAEVARLEALLRESLEHWRLHPEKAELFGGGDARTAAWTQVSRALLNLHETLYRD